MSESKVKTRILDVAANLFFTQGYNLTGINQIIQESGIARASLYNHFKSKTDLLVAYLKRADEESRAELQGVLESVSDPRERLLALIDYRLQRQVKFGFTGCRFVKISLEISAEEEKKVREVTNEHKAKFKERIRELVTEANRKKLLDDDLLTETIFLLLEGSSIQGAMSRSPASLKKTRKIVERLL